MEKRIRLEQSCAFPQWVSIFLSPHMAMNIMITMTMIVTMMMADDDDDDDNKNHEYYDDVDKEDMIMMILVIMMSNFVLFLSQLQLFPHI